MLGRMKYQRASGSRCPALAAILLAVSTLTGCVIDRSISVPPGETRGPTRVIDGDVDVERGGRIESVRVIDGELTLNEDSAVAGNAHVTDGALVMRAGTRIGGDLIAHHAELRLTGAQIDGEVELFCVGGRIEDSRVYASVRVRRKALWYVDCDGPRRLVIGPGTVIDRLVVETRDVEVEVSEQARIGEIRRL